MQDGNDHPDLYSGTWGRSNGFQQWGVFDVPGSGVVSTDHSVILKGRQDAPHCWLTPEASLTQKTLLLFTPIPSTASIKSTAGLGLCFEKYRENENYKCQVLKTLLHFDTSEALCAGDCLAGTRQGGNNLDFLCRITSVTNVKINIFIITMQRWANSRVKRILDITVGKITRT